MKLKYLLVLGVIAGLATGCARNVRSISNSGYGASQSNPWVATRELDEFDVLGLDRNKPATEEDIQQASQKAKRIAVAPGNTILLVQSGAVFPDAVMVAQLAKTFRVVPFTGVANEGKAAELQSRDQRTRNIAIISNPDQPATIIPLSSVARERYQTPPPPVDPGAYSRTLRLAAARAGAQTVICYWGILESGTEQLATKTISWLPAVNWIVPDEKQHLRINLKVALVDVATGSWSVFSSQPSDKQSYTRNPRREATDQRLVEGIKRKAYELAAQKLVESYALSAQ